MAQSYLDKGYQDAAYGNTNRTYVKNRDGTKGWKFDHGGTTKKVQLPLGGMLGGRGRGGARYAEEDFERQNLLDKLAWERSTPEITGVSGQVRWDRDNNMMTSTLSPENQAIYDDYYARQKVLADQTDDLIGGGWRSARDELYQDTLRSFASQDDRQDAARRARQVATGAGDYAIGTEDRREAAIRDQRNLDAYNNAFTQSQALIDSSLARQRGEVSMMTDVGNIANSMMNQPTPYTPGNINNASLASTRWADNLAMESAKKSKAKSDFWGSLASSIFS